MEPILRIDARLCRRAELGLQIALAGEQRVALRL
jgi:hypothetical protein